MLYIICLAFPSVHVPKTTLRVYSGTFSFKAGIQSKITVRSPYFKKYLGHPTNQIAVSTEGFELIWLMYKCNLFTLVDAQIVRHQTVDVHLVARLVEMIEWQKTPLKRFVADNMECNSQGMALLKKSQNWKVNYITITSDFEAEDWEEFAHRMKVPKPAVSDLNHLEANWETYSKARRADLKVIWETMNGVWNFREGERHILIEREEGWKRVERFLNMSKEDWAQFDDYD